MTIVHLSDIAPRAFLYFSQREGLVELFTRISDGRGGTDAQATTPNSKHHKRSLFVFRQAAAATSSEGCFARSRSSLSTLLLRHGRQIATRRASRADGLTERAESDRLAQSLHSGNYLGN